MRRLSVVLLSGLVVLLAGCGREPVPAIASAAGPAVVDVVVTPYSGPGEASPPVQRLRVERDADRLLNLLSALPESPDDDSCNDDAGNTLDLAVQRPGEQLARVRAQAFGCEVVTGWGEDRTGGKEVQALVFELLERQRIVDDLDAQRPSHALAGRGGPSLGARRHPVLMVGTDPVRVDGLLAAGQLRCPGCTGRLASWGRARPRSVREEHGPVRHHPRRSRHSVVTSVTAARADRCPARQPTRPRPSSSSVGSAGAGDAVSRRRGRCSGTSPASSCTPVRMGGRLAASAGSRPVASPVAEPAPGPCPAPLWEQLTILREPVPQWAALAILDDASVGMPYPAVGARVCRYDALGEGSRPAVERVVTAGVAERLRRLVAEDLRAGVSFLCPLIAPAADVIVWVDGSGGSFETRIARGDCAEIVPGGGRYAGGVADADLKAAVDAVLR